jgi:chromosome segregation ATPase
LADESQNFQAHPGDAWLEEALLLAAAELATFRSIAQNERQRLLQAEESARARAHALEEELHKREAAHAHALSVTREQVDEQLREREQTWENFSQGLNQRIQHLAAASEQHARDVEETSTLRRQLHTARAQVEAANDAHAQLERRLSANEEAFSEAASELQKTRDEAVQLLARNGDLSRELSASAAHCAQLQSDNRVQGVKLNEAETLRTRLEEEVRALVVQLRDARVEREQLVARSQELAALRIAHTELETRARSQAEAATKRADSQHVEIERLEARVMELAHASMELDALRALHGEVELRVKNLRADLALAESRLAELGGVQTELGVLQGEHKRLQHDQADLRAELTQARERLLQFDALQQDAERLRAAVTHYEALQSEQQAALTAAEQVATEARERVLHAEQRVADARRLEDAARGRVQEAEVDVQAARRERDQVRTAVEARLAELPALEKQLAEARAELAEHTQTRWAMLDIEKQRSAKLKSELDQARSQLLKRPGVGPISAKLDGASTTDKPEAADSDRTTVEPPSAAEWELTLDPPGSPAGVPRERVSRSPTAAVLSDTSVANQNEPAEPTTAAQRALMNAVNTPGRAREGSAYSYSEVAEEQIVVPARGPAAGNTKGPGRGSR